NVTLIQKEKLFVVSDN
ncbi:hypothetical protein EC970010_2113B, partial [Escherichia coli 97.0010]